MTVRLTFRPRARLDLDGIWNYTQAQWGSSRAEDYLRQIKNAAELLAANPDAGRACDDIRPGYRKYPVGSHMVFYRRSVGAIEIVRILHARMDVTRHLP